MSKITAIENAIISLGDGEFQKFCDTYLSKMDKYGAIHGLGMKTGTLKTTTGNPDTYFARENGKYVFVVYTTQQHSIYSKIKDDIEKCLDPEKTGIAICDIEEIVCCHTSSNLSAGDDQKLHRICSDNGIKLTLYGVDEIAQQISRNYPVIARDFLGISIDTNQIVSVDEFISMYDASETAAPLNTVFQNRVEELSALITHIRNNKVVIVHGSAGVGKTRIVLEATRNIAQIDGYKLLCVKNNNLRLFDDLITCIDRPGKYILFIDDANELAELNLVLQYAIKDNTNYQFRIVMTVRDYAKEPVIRETVKFIIPHTYELPAFSDKEIESFLNINMQITDDRYVDHIIKIAEGNPRVAYMAGKLAKETQSLEVIHDATQVYEQYYAAVIQTKLGDNRNLCLTAGILALVKAVMLERLDYLKPVLKIGNISTEEFVECIRQLSSMEVVEVHKDKVAAISDQCLANYMLYYEFFEKKRIPFSELLSVGFENFKEGVIQSVNTLLNLFAKNELRNYIESEVDKTWNAFQRNNAACFDEFARVFHVFKTEEAFLLASDKIEMIPQEEVLNSHIDFEKGTRLSGDEVLGFLTGYRHTPYFETAIELLMNYIQKSETNAVIGFSWLKNNYGLNKDSYRYDYWTEKTVIKKMLDYVEESILVQRFILAYINYVLAFEFRPSEVGRGRTIMIYDIRIVNSTGVKEYRAGCWKLLEVLSAINYLQDEILDILKKYASSLRSVADPSIAADDKPCIMGILSSINCNNLRKALIVRDLQYGWGKREIGYEIEDDLFNSSEWKLLVLLENKWIHCGIGYDEYEKQREERLIRFADTLDKMEIPNFIRDVVSITKCIDTQSRYPIVNGAEKVIQRLCEKAGFAETIFHAICCTELNIDICHTGILQRLFEEVDYNEIWKDIEKIDSKIKNVWQWGFFQALPDKYVNSYTYEMLMDFLKNDSDKDIQSSPYRNLRSLDKFLIMYPDIYVEASKIILEKITYNKFIVCIYFSFLFHDSVFTPEEVLSRFSSDSAVLRDVYFFVLKNDQIADYENHFLIAFLSLDDSWINAFADIVYERIQSDDNQNYNQYVSLWKEKNYTQYFDRIFERVSEEYDELYEWRIADVFGTIFSYEKNDHILSARQEKWILNTIEKHAKDDRIICLFSAISEVRTELRNKAVAKFLLCNDNYEMFERIQLDPNHWGGEESEIILDLQKKIEFLESLLPYVKGVKYLKHAKRIRDRIDFWKAQIEHAEVETICRKLYR